MKDVTETCKKILEGIKLVNAVGNRAQRGRKTDAKFTVRHFDDILRGSEHKKIVENGTGIFNVHPFT